MSEDAGLLPAAGAGEEDGDSLALGAGVVVAALESGALDVGTAVDTWLLAAPDGDPDVKAELSGAAELAEAASPAGPIVIVAGGFDGEDAQLASCGGGAGADAGQSGPEISRQHICIVDSGQQCNGIINWNNPIQYLQGAQVPGALPEGAMATGDDDTSLDEEAGVPAAGAIGAGASEVPEAGAPGAPVAPGTLGAPVVPAAGAPVLPASGAPEVPAAGAPGATVPGAPLLPVSGELGGAGAPGAGGLAGDPGASRDAGGVAGGACDPSADGAGGA